MGMVTTEHFRERYYREPFEPFRIVLHDGREFFVRKPTDYAISPIGTDITYAPRMQDFEIIYMKEIASLEKAELATV